MDWQIPFTLGVVALVFVGLMRGVGPADMLLAGGLVAVTVAGVITPQQAFAGFSNDGMLTVAALFVVAAALRETGALDAVAGVLLGRARTEESGLLRLLPQTTLLSAFLNNTAVVAMMLPVVSDWCRRNSVPVSRMLMPLSFATILGGTCTLIGTSTNLVVDGLLRQSASGATGHAIMPPIGFFEVAWLGVPLAIAGLTYLLLVGRWMLPVAGDPLQRFSEQTRQYLVNLSLEPTCALAGKSVEAAGLRRLPGLFLVEIQRGAQLIAPVQPSEILLVGDNLTFTGAVETIVDLERTRGLSPAPHDEGGAGARAVGRHYCEAVVSEASPLVGRSIREANFRALYNAAVVAVHRGQERLTGRVGDIVLRAGDTLLLQSGPNFEKAHRNRLDFYLVSGVPDARPVRHERAWLALAWLVILVILLVSGILPTAIAAMLTAGGMIATRCISASDARRGVQWDVLIAIAAGLGLGQALESSGAADLLAAQLRELTGRPDGSGGWLALLVVYGATMLLTEFITNNAAAALVFPIALATAEQLGIDARPLVMAVLFAASASFATPIGYQTNLMVYGPGGYQFSDFLRVGVPMNLMMWGMSVTLIPLIWPL